MSLEAALAEENRSILGRLDPRQSTVSRGRNHSDRSLSPHNQLRSTSRGRNRARSSDRRGTSRARSQGEEANYKWSILFHDPSERFVTKEKVQEELDKVSPEITDPSQLDEDDISEEEQISDDEEECDYDINDLRLPNYRLSINDYYRGKVGKVSTNKSGGGSSMAASLVNSVAKNLKLNTSNEEAHVKKEGEKLEEISEVLALEKGLQDAKTLGNQVPKETIEEVSKRMDEIGFGGKKLTVNDLVKLENAKDTKYEEYKQNLIDESKTAEVNTAAENPVDGEQEERIVKSDVNLNETSLRVSRSVTLGHFFTKGLTNDSITSYLLYMDLSAESINSLQYTLGSVVKSGDVLYIVNSVNDETDIEFYKRQCEKVTNLVITYLNLIQDPNFKLHIVIECLHQEYPKHFLNELIKYLKPSLLIVCYKLIIGDLNNYISNIPLMIVKRRAKRKKSIV